MTPDVSGPARAHDDLLDDRCFLVVERVLTLLGSRRVPYVLAGGWAVYAHGSRVPSVDTDVLLAEADAAQVIAAIRDLGVSVGPGEQFEPLPLDAPSNILGPDWELGEQDRGYVPRQVLQDRTERRELDLGAHGTLTATVPTAAALLFMKLKAYHDRRLAWRALRDPAAMARIPPADRPQIRAKDVTYYARKAGKDLYDVAFLATLDALTDALAIARANGLELDLAPLTATVPDPLRAFALDMAAGEKDHATTRWIEALGRG